jgi:hypothetical protein
MLLFPDAKLNNILCIDFRVEIKFYIRSDFLSLLLQQAMFVHSYHMLSLLQNKCTCTLAYVK